MEEKNKHKYNEDELYPPKWLNKEFFQDVLRKYESCENIEIERCDIMPGSGKGDHYASVMFRAQVSYNINLPSKTVQKYKSMIVKTMPEQEGMKMDLLRQNPYFETEIKMYEILPKMEQILRAVGDNTKLCAKIIYSALEPSECLIFEDLVEKGYSAIKDRICTLEEVDIAFGKLARIHAVSYKLLEMGYTELLDCKSSFNFNKIEKFEFFRDGAIDFKQYISEIDDLREYVPYIEKVEKFINAEVGAFFDPEEISKRGGILVLNHGDFHMKNMMVNYKEGVFQNLMLVDFQLSYYGPSALDVLYGHVMMLSPEMRLNHRNDIFAKYFETFQDVLKKLNYSGKIPTKLEFDAELRKYKRWELFLIMALLIYNHAFTDSSTELGDLAENKKNRKKYWQREDLVNEVRWQLPRLVKEGYFE